MNNLWLYRALSSFLRINYRSKLVLVVLVGIYLPRIILIFFAGRLFTPSGELQVTVIAVAAIVTLAGTLLTLALLESLLQPIFLTANSLKRYAQEGVIPQLPTHFTDEVGVLMADTQKSLIQLEASLRHLADFDQVTALPTRQTFIRILAADVTEDSSFALCALGVSNYDKIAAAFGQASVNSVMVSIAARVRELLGDEVPLSHVGSNTFVFSLDLDKVHPQLETHIESIRLAVEQELLPGLNLPAEMKAGVSIHAGGPFDPERLINEAVSAMADCYIEASTHTNFFSPKQNERARDVLLIERDLRVAIEQEQFSVHYQPIVDTSIGRVIGAEALVRWSHPERGMVSPAFFIPIAESCGLMDAIGLRVLHKVCHQLGQWAGTPLGGLKVAINLSARQFLSPDAISQIKAALDKNGVSPFNLEIELTETTVIQDTQRTLLILQELRNMGVTIAIDDFGTGYSGLSYLKTLPFDRLKIDREFIQNVDQVTTSKAICKSLIELACGLGIEVFAEGTETAAEVLMMRSLGCTLYQGYHFARPLPAESFFEAVRIIEVMLAPQQLHLHPHQLVPSQIPIPELSAALA